MSNAMTALNNGEVHRLMKDWGFEDLKGSGGHLVMKHEASGRKVQITAPGRPTATPTVALKKAASIVGVSYNEFLDGPRKLKRPATVQPDLAAIDAELVKLNEQESALVGAGVTTQAINGNNGGKNRMSDTTQETPATEQETPEQATETGSPAPEVTPPEAAEVSPEPPEGAQGAAESNGSGEGDYGSRTAHVRAFLESNEGKAFRAGNIATETGLSRIQVTTALMHLAKQEGFTRQGRGLYSYQPGAPAAVQSKAAKPKSKRGPGRPKGSTKKTVNRTSEKVNRPISALPLFEGVTEIKDGLLLKDENGRLWVAKELQIS
jgi:predicted RNA binding protein YcfA (HicA-like mRNA interferase family)